MNRPYIQKQRGTTMLLTLVFLIGLFGAIGLATDSGHVLVNKTRLQNALDAAALSAAISVNGDPAHNTANATTAGKATFDLFKGTTGNSELSGISADSLTFQYSKYLTPFTPGTAPPSFVKVSTNALPVAPILIQVVGGGTVNVGAQSTAGAVGQNCSLTPFVLCAKNTVDNVCTDDTDGDGINDCFGFKVGTELNLVQPACKNDNKCEIDTSTSLESGNFNLVDLDGLQGGKDIREALTDGTRFLCTNNNINTKPGYTWGNVRQGIDDRFNSDSLRTTTLTYPQYYANGSGNNKRVMAVSVANCAGIQNGNSDVPKIGTACLFLRKTASDASDDPPAPPPTKTVLVELFNSCEQNGTWSPTNATLNGPYKIVIFKTAGSQDS